MKNVLEIVAFWLTLLTGVGLIFIGSRFLLLPETAETAYGINISTAGDHSFHFIKGVRDIFSGLIITILLLARQYYALALVLLLGTIISITDFAIVWSHPESKTLNLCPHISAIIVCVALGIYYLRLSRKKLLL